MANPNRIESHLADINVRISEMGGLIEELLNDTISMISAKSSKIFENLDESVSRISLIHSDIENKIGQQINKRQTNTDDLTLLITTKKINDLLFQIIDRVITLKSTNKYISESENRLRITSSASRMARASGTLITQALDAFAVADEEIAKSVIERSVDLREYFNSIFRESITYMMEDPNTIGFHSQITRFAIEVEKIGEIAIQIAAEVSRSINDSKKSQELSMHTNRHDRLFRNIENLAPELSVLAASESQRIEAAVEWRRSVVPNEPHLYKEAMEDIEFLLDIQKIFDKISRELSIIEQSSEASKHFEAVASIDQLKSRIEFYVSSIIGAQRASAVIDTSIIGGLFAFLTLCGLPPTFAAPTAIASISGPKVWERLKGLLPISKK